MPVSASAIALRRSGQLLLLFAALTTAGGCAATVPAHCHDCRLCELPEPAKTNLHLILVESIIDPTSVGGMPSVQQHLMEHGLGNVERFDMMTGGTATELAAQVRSIRDAKPDCQIMLVGWSAGCTQIYNAMNELSQEGVYVDSVVYLDSLFINIVDVSTYPDNVGHNVLIYRHQRRAPKSLPNTDIYRIPLVCHYSIPTEPKTLEIIHNEILRLASGGAMPAYDPNQVPVLPSEVATDYAGEQKPVPSSEDPGDAPRQIEQVAAEEIEDEEDNEEEVQPACCGKDSEG